MNKVDIFLALLPLILSIGVYWWGYRKFKQKHGLEGPSPRGQRPYGIHGLLAFFIFSSYYIAPLVTLGTLTGGFTKAESQNPSLLSIPEYGFYKIISYVLVVLVIFWQIEVARNLRWKLQPSSLKWAKVLCIGAPIIVIFSDVLIGWVALNLLPNAEVIGSYIGGSIPPLIWAAYFYVSKRCKNTYLEVFPDNASSYMDQKSQVSSEVPSVGTVNSQVAERLIQCEELKRAGLLTDSEYETKRTEILRSI
jgi:hypothetical protein